jgi:hypothetical protein
MVENWSCNFCAFVGIQDEPHLCPGLEAYRTRSDKQLKMWVNGKSIHNNDDDECCPDFSCCRPCSTDREIREKFYKSNQSEREGMLMMFLSGALAGENVHIAGSPVVEN